jgi:glycosyltransferase involved in cell wall biosynthesis
MVLPKVLTFTITYSGKDYVLDEFIDHASRIDYPNHEHIFIDNSDDGGEYYNYLVKKLSPFGIKVYRTERGNNSREALARSQNFARRLFLEGDYKYLFSLESDILVPPSIIQELMVRAKPIIGALYMIGNDGVRVPCITIPQVKEAGLLGTRLLAQDEIDDYVHKGVKQVASCGLGATLIRRELMEKFRFFYHPHLKGHSDIFFYNDLYNNNIPAFVHTDIMVKHKNSRWTDVHDR